MAIQKETWVQMVSEILYQKNPHLSKAYNATANVINGKVVHIPQAGAIPDVEINPSSFPLTVVQRTDEDIAYVLAEAVVPPVKIANVETYELSYNKMQSLVASMTAKLSDTVGTYLLHEWVKSFAYSGSATTAAASRILTTGANTAAHMPSATGNRKKFVAKDLKSAKVFLDKQNVPADGRVAIMSPDMYEQLVDDTTLTNYRVQEYNITNGVIPKLYGFEIIVRPKVVGYKNETDLVNLASYVPDVTDCDAVVCYHQDFVEYAEGNIDFFESLADPTQLGDIYAISVRYGGRKRYKDAIGIVSIVQDIP